MNSEDRAARLKSQFSSFHEAIGVGLVRWQGVEDALFAVFLRAAGCPDKDVASAIFYSIQNFRDKLKCTRNAVRVVLAKRDGKGLRRVPIKVRRGDVKEELIAEWDDLNGRLERCNTARNSLAHFHLAVQAVVVSGHFAGGVVEGVPTLQPNFRDVTEWLKQEEDQAEPLTAQDVLKHAAAFRQLEVDLGKYAEKVPWNGMDPDPGP
jgi:hypothetical protein